MTVDEKNTDQDGQEEAADEAVEEAANEAANEATQENDFLAAAEAPQVGLVVEFVDFLKYNKKWWLTPILLVLALITALVILSATGGAPFIYTLF
jgi:hypothetical protein